ncbi:flagellar hook-basal body complex protein [Desulfovibrio sp. OttesenSCG-928-O18]|nr:flagellar hook-basal body complex protein [Desulfovibrio sp. OttesenSCG-928-O18]
MMTSLYTGCTGLKSHGVGMSSISNNIANMNTVAFKNAMTLYSDNISTSVNSASGNGITEMSQLGLGVSVNVNRTMHLQGAFMQGSAPTDLAIAGKGFFGVTKDGVTQYTRAGNFRFTNEGLLIDPNGYALMGYQVANGTASGSATPIQLDFSQDGHGYMQPKATSRVTLIENIGSRESKQSDSANQFFSLATAWDGSQNPPLSANQYGSKTTMPVYDADGNQQSLDVFYDYVGNFDGKHVYQYVIGSESAPGDAKGSGIFASGTMTFSSAGEIEDMTMFTPGGDTTNLGTWTPASFDASGNPVFAADFGKGAQNISINFGLEMNGTWTKGYANAADVNANPKDLYTGPRRPMAASKSTSYEGASGTLSSVQDGYAPGYLQDLTIEPDGTMVGRYSNSQSEDLYQIPIYRFINEEGLRHEGGNRYTATVDSGDAEEGLPQTENYGSLHEATLEQSNVDLAKEFAFMIVTQRGFQMNSKVVTTSDQMLQKALELKR